MDIVKRLRKQVVIIFKQTNEQEFEEVPDRVCQEAADEIERLRKQSRINWDAFQKATDEIVRLRKANHQLAEIANDAANWLPPASVNGPREEYQNKIKELTDGIR